MFFRTLQYTPRNVLFKFLNYSKRDHKTITKCLSFMRLLPVNRKRRESNSSGRGRRDCFLIVVWGSFASMIPSCRSTPWLLFVVHGARSLFQASRVWKGKGSCRQSTWLVMLCCEIFFAICMHDFNNVFKSKDSY